MHIVVIVGGLCRHAQRLCRQRQLCSEAPLVKTKILSSAVGRDKDTQELRLQRQKYSGALPSEAKMLRNSAARDKGTWELRWQRQRYSGALPRIETYSGALRAEPN